MSPSPHALSIAPSRGSTTMTSSPASRASIAAASPTGPPPDDEDLGLATRRPRHQPRGFERAVLGRDPEPDQQDRRSARRRRPAVIHAVCTSGIARPSTATSR